MLLGTFPELDPLFGETGTFYKSYSLQTNIT